MWMPNKNGECPAENKNGECPAEGESLAESRPTLRHGFRHVYGFILHAVRGDTAIFENYLAGKLSEELLAISRRCVTSDQASSCKREIEERDWAEQRQLTATPE